MSTRFHALQTRKNQGFFDLKGAEQDLPFDRPCRQFAGGDLEHTPQHGAEQVVGKPLPGPRIAGLGIGRGTLDDSSPALQSDDVTDDG
jgi:hypothetical protein